MTAVNLIVQRDAAYLLADGALCTPDGPVACLGSKTLIAEAMRLALVPSGMASNSQIADGLSRLGADSQHAVMAALPRVAAEIAEDNVARWPE